MYIYLIIFFTSCLFLKLSDKAKKDKGLRFILISISLLLPCLLAGMRSYVIGTDIQVYVKPLYNCAINSENFFDYLDMPIMLTRKVCDFEIGFTSIVYLISRLTNNLQFVLFAIHILIILPLYLGIKKFKCLDDKKWFSMLVFYLMFFNTSLNAMRQYIGISFIFYGTSCLLNTQKGTIKFFICLILATIFHTSSILGVFIYLVYRILKSQSKRLIKIGKHIIPMNKVFMLTIIFLLMIFVTNSNVLVSLMNNFGFNRYSQYVNGNVSFFSSSIIRVLPIIFIIFIVHKSFIKKYDNSYLYLLIYAMSVIITQFGTANVRGGRIAYLFSFFNIISFPLICDSLQDKGTKKILLVILISYLLFYWYYSFVYLGGSETIPYIFWKNS